LTLNVTKPAANSTATSSPLRLAIPIGDPAGIGPEVVLKALAEPEVARGCQVALVGSREVLWRSYRQLQNQSAQPLVHPDRIEVIEPELPPETGTNIQLGTGNAASGAASFAYLQTAVRETLAGRFHGIVTAPIAKSAWKAAGYFYPGQTELLASMAGVEQFGMLFVAQSPHSGWILRTLLATTHIPLQQVPTMLTPDLLTTKLDLLVTCLQQDFAMTEGSIAIAGLNPHSGENGQLGSEEKDWMVSWLQKQQKQYPQMDLWGPIPPDTMWVKPGLVWYGQTQETPADAYLALYHDQGLIPVKLMAFDRAVNTTVGLPFVRTSPDHGTAFDIAGQGIADATSMKAAISWGAYFVRVRQNG